MSHLPETGRRCAAVAAAAAVGVVLPARPRPVNSLVPAGLTCLLQNGTNRPAVFSAGPAACFFSVSGTVVMSGVNR